MMTRRFKYLPAGIISISILVLFLNCNNYGIYDTLLHRQSWNMFVSSVSTKGDFSDFRAAFPACDLADSVDSADCVCDALASSAAMHSRTGTKFRAGLSTTTTSPSCHIIKLTGWVIYSFDMQNPSANTTKYCDTDPPASAVLSTWQNNGVVLDSWDGMATYARYPITLYTEAGQPYTGNIWTGDLQQNCQNWTSAAQSENASTASSDPLAEIIRTCDSSLPVNCFEYLE